ncbi:AAA family ATPase [Wolbachia endosymbiont (group A) of Urophora cardui]|uniref:AAA family ATPase n=1 Tax=Wolbachia endosymbiont (group A) of Urophora cardui TaxID=3066156 RepID=UPI00333F371D
MSPSFIGRQTELKQLLELTEKNTASFVVVKGRRRIGKSRLIQEFGKHFEQHYSFAGLPPEKHTTTSHQLNEFSRQVARQFNTSFARYDDWSDLLWAVGERLLSGKILLLLDEISWMGSKDPTFLGKIKNFWDTQLKNNNKLIFVVCGSASSWMALLHS